MFATTRRRHRKNSPESEPPQGALQGVLVAVALDVRPTLYKRPNFGASRGLGLPSMGGIRTRFTRGTPKSREKDFLERGPHVVRFGPIQQIPGSDGGSGRSATVERTLLEGRSGAFSTLSKSKRYIPMAKAKKAAGKGGSLVVGSKVKDVVRTAGVRAAGDLVEAVSAAVANHLKGAIARCKANGRGTVRPHDL